MGFFSWKTSDTNESIMNTYSKAGASDIFMYLPDGRIIHEPAYEGYGVFGGIDIYEFIAEYNHGEPPIGKKLRDIGIDSTFKDNPSGEFQYCEDNGIKCPRFAIRSDSKYHDLSPPKTCPFQGYFED